MTIIRNSAKCAHCGHELVSTHRHDYREHVCETAGKIAEQYNHEKNKYEPAYPFFAVDGGKDYIRRAYTRKEDYIETSIEEGELGEASRPKP